MFRNLGRFVHQRRWFVIAGWVMLIVAGAASMGTLSARVSGEFVGSDRLEAVRVFHEIDESGVVGAEIAVVLDGLNPDDQSTITSIIATLDEVAALDGVLAVTDPWRSGIEGLRAVDNDAVLVVVSFANSLVPEVEAELIEESIELTDSLVDQGVVDSAIAGGEPIVLEEFETQAERDLQRGESIALPIALVAMIVIFGGLRAAGMPLAVAGAAFITASLVLLGATYLMDNVSVFAINVVTMMGIGLGIDYGLLMVSRFREERGMGLDVGQAVESTVASAGVTIVFSALTVAVAMSGMFVFNEPTMTAFGIGGMAAVLLSMLAGITLLPALLSLAGNKIKPMAPTVAGDGYFFRLSGWVQRHALPVVVVVSAALILAATPFLDARLENGDARSLPQSSEAREVALTLEDRFPSRGADPVIILADVEANDPAWLRFRETVAGLDNVIVVAERGGFDPSVTVLDIIPTGTTQGEQAQDLVKSLRAMRYKEAVEVDYQVGGTAAFTVDTNGLIRDRMPWAIGIVVIATLVLLFAMTGSVAIPIKAVVMNILSLGASFGALVWIFQDGHLSGLLGFEPIGTVDMWIPTLVLLFAFGLSMDYEVFLISRIKEVHDATGDNDLSVSMGLQKTGRIITSAALLIVVVFAGFAAGEVLTIKQLGMGMAIAVIVDATIVRSLLVPAAMKLMGEWNWWAPEPLRRLHQRFGLHEPSSKVGSGPRGPQNPSDPPSPPSGGITVGGGNRSQTSKPVAEPAALASTVSRLRSRGGGGGTGRSWLQIPSIPSMPTTASLVHFSSSASNRVSSSRHISEP